MYFSANMQAQHGMMIASGSAMMGNPLEATDKHKVNSYTQPHSQQTPSERLCSNNIGAVSKQLLEKFDLVFVV